MNKICYGPHCINKISYPKIVVRKRIDREGGKINEFCSWKCVKEYAAGRARLEKVELIA